MHEGEWLKRGIHRHSICERRSSLCHTHFHLA